MLYTLRIKYVEHLQTNSQRKYKSNFRCSTNNIPIVTETE